MQLASFVLVLGAVISITHANDAVFSATNRLVRNVEEVFGHGGRVKRQTSPYARSVILLCVQSCAAEMKSDIDRLAGNSGGLEFGHIGHINKEMLNATTLTQICTSYNEARQCIDECGEFAGKAGMMNAFMPMQFMCVDRFDDLQKYFPCFNKSKEPIQQHCGGQCGGLDFVEEKMEEQRQFKEANNMPGMLGVMADLCGFIQCELRCSGPVMTDVCQDPEPAKLMQELISVTIGSANKMLEQLSPTLVRKQCKAVENGEFTESEQDNGSGAN